MELIMTNTNIETLENQPGVFGKFGGRFVPDQLHDVLETLANEFDSAMADPQFVADYEEALREIAGRPSNLYFAKRLTEKLGGAKIYLKREDLNHTGAHKINNTLGQALLAVRMGKKRIIAETGAGQHGVATATAAAAFGLECEIFMGAEDCRRQALNVFRMELLGAKVTPVTAGQQTLADACDAALEKWITCCDDTNYILGSVCGPDPFPRMVRDFQKIIGIEARQQMLDLEGQLPDYLIACVGGGSNAAGLFAAMIPDESIKIIGVEPGGRSLEPGQHAAAICKGAPGILHGSKSYVIVENDGSAGKSHSISAGLDYPGVGPEHAHWHDIGRVQYTSVSDKEAIDAFLTLSQTEGIIPAMESSHAVAQALKLAPTLESSEIIIVNLSGRGDKDCQEIRTKMAELK